MRGTRHDVERSTRLTRDGQDSEYVSNVSGVYISVKPNDFHGLRAARLILRRTPL